MADKKRYFLTDAQRGEIARYMIQFPDQTNISIARLFEIKLKLERSLSKDVIRRIRDKKEMWSEKKT
jgi:hypothetical protein